MADLRDKRVELILQQLEELPTLPAVAVRVLQATSDDASSGADVVKLISSDPALSTRILQLCRRADRGVRDDVQTIDRAVMLLGFDAVRNAVLAVSVFQALGGDAAAAAKPPTASAFNREQFWTHCLAVACCAELLAEQAPRTGVSAADAFLGGLLHDLGKLALDVALPKSYARVIDTANLLRGDIADVERSIIGIDHQVVGKRLAERWQLPPVVRDVAWLHGQPPAAIPATVRANLINLVTLADLLVRQQHLGYSGNYTFSQSRDALLAAVGISAKQVEQALSALVGRMEPRAAALGLGTTTSDHLYRQALAQANRELAKVDVQLASRRRRLQERERSLEQRGRFLDVLRRFQGTLRADANPQQALAAIADAAGGMLGADRCCAFSLPAGRDYAEAVICDADGVVLETTLVETPGMSDLTRASPLTDEELAAIAAFAQHDSPHDAPYNAPLSGGSPENSEPRHPHREDAADAASLPANITQIDLSGSSLVGVKLVNPPAPSDNVNANPVLPVGDDLEWLTGSVAPRLAGDRLFWICLQDHGACIGGVLWGASANDSDRLAAHGEELSALAGTWVMALRSAQEREDSRSLSEELADANRRLTAAQDALLRTRSLTTVGEMAAGAAHEMNNPLAVISGRSQLLSQIIPDQKQKQMAKLVFEQAQRLSGIITELMAFAKPHPPEPQPCNVRQLIDDGVSRAKSIADPAGRGIDITVGETPVLSLDVEQVSGAVAEAVANAIQATKPTEGRIAVRAAHDPWSGNVVIAIVDNGIGMNAATLARAFDPFFSSKTAGRQRGLGLARALRWVEANGGSIRLESEPGNGTRVLLLLPVAPPVTTRIDVEVESGKGAAQRIGEGKFTASADDSRSVGVGGGTKERAAESGGLQ